MKITIRRSGGFAGPLLNKTFEVQTESMPPRAARRLETLIGAAPLASLRDQRFHARTGADLFKYEVNVETAEGPVKFFFDESAVPSEFKSVWEILQTRMEG